MPSGLIALLDDVATIAKLAAASVDDIGAAAGKAGVKAAGVVIDDTAVTPRYVTGLAPERELPIIAKIAVGSLKNKLLILLPVALLLVAFAPFLLTPLLMIGGAYLAFEATEKIVESITGDHHDECELLAADTPQELEARQVAGAIRTDFILSAEIMAIALAELEGNHFAMQAAALAAVAVLITVGVYGVVGLIVKLDDIGLHMAEREGATSGTRALGRGLVRVVPPLLRSLGFIGTAAMLWVGGGILLHGLEEMHLAESFTHSVHGFAEWFENAIGFAPAVMGWLANALASALLGFLVGVLIIAAIKLVRFRPVEPVA